MHASAMEPNELYLRSTFLLPMEWRITSNSSAHATHPIDDTPAREKPHETTSNGGAPAPDSNQLLAQYEQIGATLAACEASSWRAGVPWLPPTARVRALPRMQGNSCEAHVRFALVGISTKALESFCEDLDSLSARSLDSLHVPNLSPFERRVYFGAATTFGGLVGFLVGALVGAGPTISLLLVASAAISGGILAVLTSTETYRRTTFSWIIEGEIRRRLGGDDPSSNNLRICPTANN